MTRAVLAAVSAVLVLGTGCEPTTDAGPAPEPTPELMIVTAVYPRAGGRMCFEARAATPNNQFKRVCVTPDDSAADWAWVRSQVVGQPQVG